MDYFLETVSKWFDLVVFTASMEVYGKGLSKKGCTPLYFDDLYLLIFKAVCDKLEENKVIFKRRLYRQDCRLEFQSYTKVN